MKKIYTYTKLMLLALISTVAFSSCDDDTMLAWDLDGVWEGTISGDYYNNHYGYSDYDTQIMFHQSGSWGSGGDGYEIDRNVRTGRYSKVWFTWSVRNGRIYMDYEDGYRIIIRDFETYWMGNRMRFRGYFDDYDTGETLAWFNLIKVESSSDYYDYYYTKQQEELNDTTSTVIKIEGAQN
jgi:hypothetical protein